MTTSESPSKLNFSMLREEARDIATRATKALPMFGKQVWLI